MYYVPENEGSSMIAFMEKLLRDKLGIPPTTELLYFERVHRVLAPKPAATGKSRSIVIKFLWYTTQQEVLRKTWEKKEILLNNQRIFFQP